MTICFHTFLLVHKSLVVKLAQALYSAPYLLPPGFPKPFCVQMAHFHGMITTVLSEASLKIKNDFTGVGIANITGILFYDGSNARPTIYTHRPPPSII